MNPTIIYTFQRTDLNERKGELEWGEYSETEVFISMCFLFLKILVENLIKISPFWYFPDAFVRIHFLL